MLEHFAGPGVLPDLFRTLGPAEGRRDSGLRERPVDCQLGHALSNLLSKLPQPIHQVLVLFPLLSLEHRVLRPTIAGLGTNLARYGTTRQSAQSIVRHADYRTTLKHYTVLGLTDTAKAIDQLPDIEPPATDAAQATGTTGEIVQDDPHLQPHQRQRESVRSGATRRCQECRA